MPYLYENSKQNFTNIDHFKEIAIKTINELFGRVKPLDNFDFRETDTTYVGLGHYDSEGLEAGDVDALTKGEAIAREKHDENIEKAKAEAEAEAARLRDMIAKGLAPSEEDMAVAFSLGINEELEKSIGERFALIKKFYDAEDIQIVKTAPGTQIEINVIRDNETIVAKTLVEIEEYMANNEPPGGQGGDNDEDETVVETKEVTADRNKKYTLDEILKASDGALELANENGVDLKLVTGTGAGGNIVKGDVEKFIKANKAPEQENANGNTGTNA